MTIPPPKPVLSLVPNKPDDSLIDFLEEALKLAEKGELTGIAYVLIFKGGNFDVDTKGATMNAMMASGALQKLNQELLASI